MKKATAYIDGSGNSPSVQACATVIYIDDECHKRARLLPPNTTSNVGEYSGLLLAISLAQELGVDELQIYSDSNLIVNQFVGRWKCKQPHLIPLRDEARANASALKKVSIHWIPREKNEEADSLCREAVKASQLFPYNPFLQPKNPFMKT